MSKIAIVYWSGTGNTKAMADYIEAGAKEAGADVNVFTSAEFSVDKVGEYTGLAFGCPSMGAEELEETEFEPLFSGCKDKLAGKKVALFGSYGWGDGEWMRTWQEDCEASGIMMACEPVIANEAPGSEAEMELKQLALALA